MYSKKYLKVNFKLVKSMSSKDLVPRFKCPLCGWLAYYSMLDRGPYKLEIKGMRYDGFQEISYHRIWTGKKDYKEFLRLKVRELAKELGLKLVDEEEAIDYDEEEIEVESSDADIDGEEVTDEDLESLGLRPATVVTKTPSQTIPTQTMIDIAVVEQPSVDPEMVKVLQKVLLSRSVRTLAIQSGQKSFGRIIKTDATFIGGEDNG